MQSAEVPAKAAAAAALPPPPPPPPRLFLDMDGVFCDFELGYQRYREIAGEKPIPADDMEASEWPLMIKQSANAGGNFWADLPPMDKSITLYGVLRGDFLPRIGQRIPIFLTGCPAGKNRIPAEKGKRQWIATHLLRGASVENVHVISVAESAKEDAKECYLRVLDLYLKHEKEDSAIVIFCLASQKNFFSGVNQILLDDKEKNGVPWVAKGGIFVHHESAPEKEGFMDKAYRNSKSAEAVGKSIKAIFEEALGKLRGGGRRKGTRRLKRRRRQTRR